MSDTVSATISSRRNARVVEARKLAQRKHRARQGRFLVEGLQLLGMGLDAGARPREAFYCPELASSEAASRLVDRMAEAGADVLVVTPHVMSTLAERDAPQGLIATFDTFGSDMSEATTVDVPSDGLVVVLDRLQDPGNLGTLIRTADAVGSSAVVLVQPSVDPFEPKAVRGSMGSVFNVPLVFARDADVLFAWLGDLGLRAVVADAHSGEPWGDTALAGGIALLLGNEARGLSADLEAGASTRARLPMTGGAESLNVAIAGGVLMFAWLRQHQKRGAD